MDKMKSTAKKLDVFFRIVEILTKIGWIAALVGAVAALGCLIFLPQEAMLDSGFGTLDLGYAQLQVPENEIANASLMLIQASVTSAAAVVFMVVFNKAIKQVRRILSPMIQGQPFSGEVGTGLKKLAGLSVIGGILGNVTILVEQIFNQFIFDIPGMLNSDVITHVSFNYELDLSFLLLAAVLLLMSYVFSYGEELQQLSDETL